MSAMKLVPVEPTRKMLSAAVKRIGGGSTFDREDRIEIARGVYGECLAAAPEAPAADVGALEAACEDVSALMMPLEWEPKWGRTADTPFGRYSIDDGESCGRSWEVEWRSTRRHPKQPIHKNIEAARKWAEADFVDQMTRFMRARVKQLCDPALARLDAALAARETQEPARYRHKKRGTTYQLLGIGKMQTEDWVTYEFNKDAHGFIPVDMAEVAIYRSEDDGSLWVRPREEFEDGRFEALARTTAAQTGGGDDR